VLLGLAIAAVDGERTGHATAQENKQALPADLARIPPDSFFIGSLNVSGIWNSGLAKDIREKAAVRFPEFFQEVEKFIGVDIQNVERITLVSAGIGPDSEPVGVIGTKNAIDKDRALKLALPDRTEKKVDNVTIYVGKNRSRFAMAFLDSKVLAIGEPRTVEAFVGRSVAKIGPLSPVLEAAASGKHAVAAGFDLTPLAKIKDQLPADAEPIKALLDAKSSLLTVDMTDKLTAELRGTFADAKDAETAKKAAEELRTLLAGLMDEGIKDIARQGEQWKRIVDLMKLAQTAVKEAKVQRADAMVQATLSVKIDSAAILDAVQKWHDATKQAKEFNNLKQIALALLNYHDTYGTFPPAASYDKNGKPLLSWRVLILPFLDEDKLHKEFRLDEPWDSAHNKKLLERMPKVYRAAEEDGEKHLTRYLSFVGKDAFFEGAKGRRIAQITDGLSNTLMAVEAPKGVPWSKPEDISFGEGKLLPLLVNPKKGGFNVVFADGSARFLPKTVKEEVMRLLVQINDGKPLPADFDK
jgi:prepilin-type processing-associated H-X9-DG protein